MRLRRSFAAALVLTLILVADALAVSWTSTIKLTSSRNAAAWFGLATTGSSTVHAVYEDAKGGIRGVYYRRSGDSGSTWATPVRLSNAASGDANTPAIATYGSQVDVVWLDEVDPEFELFVVKYRRSLDQGLTWQGTIRLGGTAGHMATPSIARDSAGRLIVTWTNPPTQAVMVQISANNGASWSTPKAIGATTNDATGFGDWDAFPAAAGGTGALYVAWWGSATTLYVSRSIDGGVTWGAKATLTTAGYGDPISIAASSSSAVVAYTEASSTLAWIATRRTSNKGGTWASRVALTSTTSGNPSVGPVIRYVGGKWRVALERCAAVDCLASAVWYRDSSDAVSWSTLQKVSTSTRPYSIADGIAMAGGRVIVMYHDLNFDTLDSDVFVRLGT